MEATRPASTPLLRLPSQGLLAGERLQHALRQMEVAYLDAYCREYELTKHVSLRLHFPLAFLHPRATGACEIEIPEWMFDFDYPGHYLQRIKKVTLTLLCVVGPYIWGPLSPDAPLQRHARRSAPGAAIRLL